MLRVLDTHHILSAPVFAANSSRCVGWISVGDVLRAILGWAALMDDPSPAGRVENLRRAGARLETSRVRDIARANDGSLLLAASEGISLLDVVRDGLLRGSGGCGADRRGGGPPARPAAATGLRVRQQGGGQGVSSVAGCRWAAAGRGRRGRDGGRGRSGRAAMGFAPRRLGPAAARAPGSARARLGDGGPVGGQGFVGQGQGCDGGQGGGVAEREGSGNDEVR